VRLGGRLAGAIAVGAVLVLGGSLRWSPPVVPPPKGEDPVLVQEASVKEEPTGLRLRLSEGAAEPEPRVQPPVAPATPLDEPSSKSVLDRLPPLKAEASDRAEFLLRERSLPPPLTGTTLKAVFPPAEAPEAPPKGGVGPLEVLRHAPEGEVPLAPHLSVTFSQPIVALSSHAESIEHVPVKLFPEPSGKWRWVGTNTLLFEPAGRFPMATEYRVEVPPQTKSAIGGTLAVGRSWAFSTPPPTIVSSYPPSGPSRRDTLLFVLFDQRIEAKAVLATIRVDGGGSSHPLRIATPGEIEADETVRELAKRAEPGRWLAFRCVEDLPKNSTIAVTVGPETPSAEGSKKTTKSQTWSFHTHGALRVTSNVCGWSRDCPPGTPWVIEFSNPIDPKVFRKAMLRVDPELPELSAEVYGETLYVYGRSKGRTQYKLTLSEAISDTFGQTLGAAQTVSFTVTAAPKSLWAGGGSFIVLDPSGGSRLSIYTINHTTVQVRAYAVEPTDWPAFQTFLQGSSRGQSSEPPGRSVLKTTQRVAAQPDDLTETQLDLSSVFKNGLGQAVVIVEPIGPSQSPQRVEAWVEATQIGLDAFVDQGQLIAWASSLKDGKPLPNVPIELWPAGPTASSDSQGLAKLPLGTAVARVLIARHGKDTAMLPENESSWAQQGWRNRPKVDSLRWCVFDDRHLYRPDEEVKVKGWVRLVGGGGLGDVSPLGSTNKRVRYSLKDSLGNEITNGSQAMNEWGGFEVSLKLPPTMNLGSALLLMTAEGDGREGHEHIHTFEVQEFRRPEFETTTTASEGPHFIGGSVNLTLGAAYYAGGPLANADVSWRITSALGSFTPPNRSEFVFGTWEPWWEGPRRSSSPERVKTFAAKTDSLGKHHLRIDFEGVRPPRPTTVRAEATVMDVNRQAWASGVDLLVHPADLYVGLKSERLFVQQGESLTVDAIVTDLDGKAMAGRTVVFRAERLEWELENGWKEKAVDPQEKTLESGSDAVRCTFQAKEGGPYRVTASVADKKGRSNQSQLRLWVAGGRIPPRRDLAQETVTLVPNKKEYKPGETAEVLVLAPFPQAEGVLTLRRSGILRTERFSVAGSSHTVRVKIEESWTPNVHLQVDLIGAAPRTTDDGKSDPNLPRRPAFAKGELNLAVPPLQRTLALKVLPREKSLQPGGQTMLDLELRDVAQRPVGGAEVAVVVVDEAVLSLAGYRFPDPVKVFYQEREAGARDHHLRQSIQLARPEGVGPAGGQGGAISATLAAPGPAQSAMAMRKAAEYKKKDSEPIRLRSDFNALALFAGSVPTDSAGRASVTVKVPDTLTRYRVAALAVTEGNRFGVGESTLTARLPLIVRPSPPRFLNFGDRFELGVVLQNQTDSPLGVDVAVRALNAEFTHGQGRRLRVPPNDRVEVRFEGAARSAGTARFQVAAVSGQWADAAEFSLKVYTPATTEAFATYGQIDQGGLAQPVMAPEGAVPEFGGLEITTSSTALQALTDAVLYLVAYKFECAEQMSSRLLAVAALRDVLTAFEAQGLPPSEEMIAAVKRDIDKLRVLQNDDGGFAFWRRGDPSWPYISIHAAHALQRAKEKGFDVPQEMLERSRGYLRDIDKHIPASYSGECRRTLAAYSLHVRQRMGETDAPRARRLMSEAGPSKLSFEALGWLLGVVSKDPGGGGSRGAILTHLANRATETASTAHFAVAYGDGAHLLLYSDRRADAVLLEALIGEDPKNSLIPKLVEGLLGQRRAGRWENTQENAFVLLALDRYFHTYEGVTPDFVARAWLGGRYAGEHAFKGHTTERQHLRVPMKILTGAGPRPEVALVKEGQGRLYYRIGMEYAPASLKLDAADHGFGVERVYEAVDDPRHVQRDGDGTWRVQSGARVRVHLTMVTAERRYHVALVDWLPAGLEPQNPAQIGRAHV